ncbi:hypothetical protein ACFFRR_003119 [Megaselia abdita]
MVHIKGRAKIKFRYGKSVVKGKQKFMDQYLLVVSNIRLPSGPHTFLFESDLPSNCPPSFKGKHGYIRYEAIIVIPRMCCDKRIPFEFHILSYSPLPYFDSNIPLKINICSTNTVSFPKNVFRVGEYILVNIDIDEVREKKKTRIMKFYLVQYIWYQSKKQCGTRQKKKQKGNVEEILISTSDFIYKQGIRIPDNIPTTLEYLEIIKIRYILKIYIDNQKFKLPIVIGDYYQS